MSGQDTPGFIAAALRASVTVYSVTRGIRRVNARHGICTERQRLLIYLISAFGLRAPFHKQGAGRGKKRGKLGRST